MSPNERRLTTVPQTLFLVFGSIASITNTKSKNFSLFINQVRALLESIKCIHFLTVSERGVLTFEILYAAFFIGKFMVS